MLPYLRKMFTFSALVLCAALVVTGCASTKTAATPADQAILDAGRAVQAADREMHQINVDHLVISTRYATGCNPAARSIGVVDCNKWSAFDDQFRLDYRRAGNALDVVRAGGSGQAAVDAAVAKLRNDLNQYK